MPNCNSSDLSVFIANASSPWNKQKIQHIYRRLGFGASITEIDLALTQTPSVFIDDLINQAIAIGVIPPPTWAEMTYNEYEDLVAEVAVQYEELYVHFENDMLSNSLRGRFTLFWHNHFVTRLEDYECPSWMFNYYQTIQTYIFGNFKDFVKAIGLTPAMLVFLGGYQNTDDEPNENYARELYELFTLGVNNGYTQYDIINTAKALTGYTSLTDSTDYCTPIIFNNDDFYNGNKTIFGQTGNWGYNDVIDILFQERGSLIANYICTKIYSYFVSPEVNENIVSAMATTFINNNFELAPVYRELFKSNHFFDQNAIGTIVKSPYDIANCFIKETEFILDDELKKNVIIFNGDIGQKIFDPVDVAGWQGNHEWINSSTLIGRWLVLEYYLGKTLEDDNELLRTLALNLNDSNETDPAIVTQNIVNHFISKGLQTQEEYNIATEILKYEVPQNYYDNNLWNLSWDTVPYQVYILLLHIVRLPAFQLK